MSTDDKLAHIAQLLSNSSATDSDSDLLNEVKEALNKIKIQKDAPAESTDVSKLKDTLVDLRRKNIELRRQSKEINDQFLSQVPNPTEDDLRSMEVSQLTRQRLTS
jgi:hypothetical protein